MDKNADLKRVAEESINDFPHWDADFGFTDLQKAYLRLCAPQVVLELLEEIRTLRQNGQAIANKSHDGGADLKQINVEPQQVPVAWHRLEAHGCVTWRPGAAGQLEDGAPLYAEPVKMPPFPMLPKPFAHIGDYSACGGTLSLVRADNDDRMCKVIPVFTWQQVQQVQDWWDRLNVLHVSFAQSYRAERDALKSENEVLALNAGRFRFIVDCPIRTSVALSRKSHEPEFDLGAECDRLMDGITARGEELP